MEKTRYTTLSLKQMVVAADKNHKARDLSYVFSNGKCFYEPISTGSGAGAVLDKTGGALLDKLGNEVLGF